MMTLAPELQRRASATAAVLALFQSKPGQWIDSSDLMKVGGSCGWRTRVADARKIVAAEGGCIENRQHRDYCSPPASDVYFVISEYRYLVQAPLGRSADVPAPTLWPVFDAPSQETWRLT